MYQRFQERKDSQILSLRRVGDHVKELVWCAAGRRVHVLICTERRGFGMCHVSSGVRRRPVPRAIELATVANVQLVRSVAHDSCTDIAPHGYHSRDFDVENHRRPWRCAVGDNRVPVINSVEYDAWHTWSGCVPSNTRQSQHLPGVFQDINYQLF